MYDFIDVNEVSGGGILPSEALQINGEYLEHLVPGYRTLHVQGREALSPDVVSFTTGSRDGSNIKSKRYPERILTVTYQLVADSNEQFREAYNKLAAALDVEDAQLIFDDEPDKFYVGTPCMIDTVKPGRNAVTGDFEILCADPFKYSVVEYEAQPDLEESSILIDYNGTYPAFPVLEADFYGENETEGETVTPLSGAGDCGYVAFFTEDEQIIQLGDPEELDGEEVYAKSQTLANSVFDQSTSWGAAAKSQWTVNAGTTFASSFSQTGTMGMKVSSYAVVSAPSSTSGTILTASSKSGAPITDYKITAKSSGRTASSVKVTFSVTTSLSRSSSYFGYGYGLVGHLYVNGAWKTFTIKKTSSYWKGKTGHTVNVTATVSGLSEIATSISGMKFKVTRSDSLGQAGILGETGCKALSIAPYQTKTPESYYLAPSGFGSGSSWHGPTITRTLPADASGVTGAQNFTLTYSHKLSIGSSSSATNQMGAFQAVVSGDNSKIIAGVSIEKSSSGKKAKVKICVNGSIAESFDVDLSNGNAYFKDGKSSTITKVGQNVTFSIGGIKKSYKVDEIQNMLAKKVTFGIYQYGTKTTLEYNGLNSAKFVKNNCDTLKDIPNKFSANDVLTADCRNGEIRLNGVLSPSLGALGNDWETFVLTPGLNQIGFSWSEWVQPEYAPSLKIRYREVFL